MYDGKMESVQLKCDSDMMRVIIDQFGREVYTIPCENDQFIADVKVSVSPIFFGWLFGFGGKIRIVHPESIVEDYIRALKNTMEIYSVAT